MVLLSWILVINTYTNRPRIDALPGAVFLFAGPTIHSKKNSRRSWISFPVLYQHSRFVSVILLCTLVRPAIEGCRPAPHGCLSIQPCAARQGRTSKAPARLLAQPQLDQAPASPPSREQRCHRHPSGLRAPALKTSRENLPCQHPTLCNARSYLSRWSMHIADLPDLVKEGLQPTNLSLNEIISR